MVGMKKRKMFWLLLFLGIFLFILILSFIPMKEKKSSLNSKFLEQFRWKTVSEDNFSKKIFGTYKDIVVHLNVFNKMSNSQVDGYISDELYEINLLYREIDSPYAGPLTNKVICTEEFKPRTIYNKPFNYYRMYASSRLTYGVCSWDLIKYRSVIFFLYCDNSTLYHFELFIPITYNITAYTDSIKYLQCK